MTGPCDLKRQNPTDQDTVAICHFRTRSLLEARSLHLNLFRDKDNFNAENLITTYFCRIPAAYLYEETWAL